MMVEVKSIFRLSSSSSAQFGQCVVEYRQPDWREATYMDGIIYGDAGSVMVISNIENAYSKKK